jgi:nitrate reductase delta subunit
MHDLPPATLDLLAKLYEYPDEHQADRHAPNLKLLDRILPEGSRGVFESFGQTLLATDLPELQEAYVQSFDGNKECALEIGWHAYGESYHRGMFLVQLREHLARLGLQESTELPDHLTHVLRVLPRLDRAERTRLIRLIVLPALLKVRDGLKSRCSLFEPLLEGTTELLRCALEETPHPVGGRS